MKFQTEDGVSHSIHARQKQEMEYVANQEQEMETVEEQELKAIAKECKRQAWIQLLIWGSLGIGVCAVIKNWFPMTFFAMVYFDIILNDLQLPGCWIRGLLSVPVAELLISMVLLYLLWSRTVTDDSVMGPVCIGLFFNGLLNMVIYLYAVYKRKMFMAVIGTRQ